jgi:hypothetical protein
MMAINQTNQDNPPSLPFLIIDPKAFFCEALMKGSTGGSGRGRGRKEYGLKIWVARKWAEWKEGRMTRIYYGPSEGNLWEGARS